MSVRKTQFGLMVDSLREFEEEVIPVRDWIKAAIADGWSIRPTYEHESVERAARLYKNGWTAMILMRPPEKSRGVIDITVWADDGLVVTVPLVYSWEQLLEGKKKCHYCNSIGVKTERLGFAGRCCGDCIEKQRKIHEFPGWNN